MDKRLRPKKIPDAESRVPLSVSEVEKLERGPEDVDFSFSFEDQIASGLDRRSLRGEEP